MRGRFRPGPGGSTWLFPACRNLLDASEARQDMRKIDVVRIRRAAQPPEHAASTGQSHKHGHTGVQDRPKPALAGQATDWGSAFAFALLFVGCSLSGDWEADEKRACDGAAYDRSSGSPEQRSSSCAFELGESTLRPSTCHAPAVDCQHGGCHDGQCVGGDSCNRPSDREVQRRNPKEWEASRSTACSATRQSRSG